MNEIIVRWTTRFRRSRGLSLLLVMLVGGADWPDDFDVDAVASRRDSGGQPTLAPFDRLAESLIREHRLPGLAIAVTDGGRLVHACGYGCGDLDSQTGIGPTSLFRIASLSKPVTAVAVLQLVRDGRLSLDDPVVRHLGMDEEFRRDPAACDPRWQQVTIEQLLQHRGGWDRDQSFDAMFQAVRFAEQLGIRPPAAARDVIRAMVTHPFDFDPGQRYAYSNFGYNLLGRVIEHHTGSDYETYVRRQVLEPLGITDMRIGATRAEGRASNEVRYYHPGSGRSVFADDQAQPVPHPYGAWNLEAMDAHGGWIASVVDLARFATAFDDPERCPLLGRDQIERMHRRPPTARPAANADGDTPPDAAGPAETGGAAAGPTTEEAVYYSLGWNNRQLEGDRYNRWHVGSLPGTTAILIRRHDGRNFVALVNSRWTPSNRAVAGDIDQRLHQAAAEVDQWPTIDGFEQAR